GAGAFNTPLNDTWEWDGAAWTQRRATDPAWRSCHAMAWDSAREVSVLFGGFNDETWERDGTSWTRRMVTGPEYRYWHAMAFDAPRGVPVLFGGKNYDRSFSDTWEGDGTNWTRRIVTGPSPRLLHAMAYDAARGVTVLFGGVSDYCFRGCTSFSDTWEWNGTSWAQRIVHGPSPRVAHHMAYDAVRGVTVLYGGDSSDETWEWDGTSWTRRSATGPSVGGPMAYDA